LAGRLSLLTFLFGVVYLPTQYFVIEVLASTRSLGFDTPR
jgi:hypothetical protein